MSFFWFLFFLVLLQVLCLSVGFLASKKHLSQKDYYIAGKKLSFFPLLMTFVATQVGGGLILGSAEEAYRLGWKIFFYPLGTVCGFFLLSSVLGKKLSELPVTTVAQIFEIIYGSKFLKQVASLLSIVTLLMITVAQVLASQKFLACFHLDQSFWFYVFWMAVFLYTMLGGMEGIAWIDSIQAFYFIGVLGLSMIPLCLNSQFSLESLFSSHSFSSPEFNLSEKSLNWFLMPCLFMLIEQDMAQRCFSARSPSVVKKAALSSGIIVLIISGIPILFGLFGKSQGLLVINGESVLLKVIQSIASPVLSAAVACAVMMAIISTASSLIHSISSHLSQDFEISKNRIWVSKSLTLFIGCVALWISFYFKNIVDVLIQSYELFIVTLFFPILMGLFSKKRNIFSAFLSIGFGFLAFLFFHLNFFIKKEPLCIPIEIFELITSLIGYGIGSLIDFRKKR